MDDLIIVKARIKVLTSDEGGKRKTGIASGYRPNHIFEMNEDGSFKDTYIGDIHFSEQEFIYPGDEIIATIRFLRYEPILKYIYVGKKWYINEAQRRIADAEITEIVKI